MKEETRDYVITAICMTGICALMFGAPWIIFAVL